ncbi:MAG TPA: glycosyltransferase [Casimicrobiaceae bacterium]|nr:glycosyltransferase [Casimicrobiaceae bacterium]
MGIASRTTMISFVVPAHNEERLLGATLDSIHGAAQTAGEPYEIVVADDASTDRTAQLAQEHGAIVVSVAYRQISATRNAGARAARGGMLMFVDADTRVNPRVVTEAVRAMRQGAMGGGAAIRFDGVVPLYARLLLPVLVFSFRLSRIAAGCFIFCTREAFATVGGFDETYYGAEEIVMSKALRSYGTFVILDVPVVTSGRKLRTYSATELFAATFRLALRGRKAVQQREGLEIWYSERRPDSHSDA